MCCGKGRGGRSSGRHCDRSKDRREDLNDATKTATSPADRRHPDMSNPSNFVKPAPANLPAPSLPTRWHIGKANRRNVCFGGGADVAQSAIVDVRETEIQRHHVPERQSIQSGTAAAPQRHARSQRQDVVPEPAVEPGPFRNAPTRRRGTRRAGTRTSGPSGRRCRWPSLPAVPPVCRTGVSNRYPGCRTSTVVVPQHQRSKGARRLHQPLPGLGDHC